MQIRLRDPLSYPAGVAPGFDPTHFASRLCTMSVVAQSKGMVNLLNGASGGLAGSLTAPPFSIDRNIGPCINPVTVTDGWHFNIASQPSPPTLCTIAAVVIFTVVGSTGQVFVCTTGATGGIAFSLSFLGNGQLDWAQQGVADNQSSSIVLAAKTPYFIVGSGNSATFVNFAVTNLLTGQVKTQALSSTSVPAAQSAGYVVGNTGSANSVTNGFIAAAMVNGQYMSVAQLSMWATDPWSFWYPSVNDDIFAQTVGVRAFPEGRFDIYRYKGAPHWGHV